MTHQGDKTPPEIPGGYFLFAKNIQDDWLVNKPPLWSKLWNWMQCQAFYRDGTKLKRGQFHTSIKEMQEAMSYPVGARIERPTKDQIRRSYEGFTKATMIATTKTTRGLVITILNYDRYQDPASYESHSESHSENPTNAARTPHDRRRKYNKEKALYKKITESEALYIFYVQKIDPLEKTKQRAIKNISSHLKKYSLDLLKTAVINYQDTASQREPKYRKNPANFFGKNEQPFIDYLPENHTKVSINSRNNTPLPIPKLFKTGDESIYENRETPTAPEH